MPFLRPRSMPTAALLPCGLGSCSTIRLQYQRPRASCENVPDLIRPFSGRCIPQPDLAPVESDDGAAHHYRLVLEGHPSEVALAAPAQLGLAGSAAPDDV